ncbi:hypothetical protein [uncultured Dokdonia sp.]|uniref:tetratricopeptide repeat protein n=1 Tax=uncultured Dokdonia sp. TaxID=575653 RepID=UPI002612C3BC|nr:hypothetical protein [uncultured Dokdonia sp.]
MKIERINQEYIDRFTNDEYPIKVTKEKLLDFVTYTNHIDRPKEERVLVLALDIGTHEFENGWKDVQLLYDYSLEHCKKEERFDYLIDWIVSALYWYNDYATDLYKDRVEIANACLLKLEEAIDLEPNKASINHLFGIFYYDHPSMEEAVDHKVLKKAVSYFLKAFEIDSLKYISCFFAAHCYHDMKDWEKAKTYYEKIDKEFFIRKNPHWEWRIWKLEEQICLCYAMTGDIEQSKTYFKTFLSKIEEMNDEDFDDLIVNFDESVQLVLKIKDDSLTKRLLDMVISKGYKKRYETEIKQLQAN